MFKDSWFNDDYQVIEAYYRWSTGIYFYIYVKDGTPEEDYRFSLGKYLTEDAYA